jgi:hypothetical protein
VFKVEKEKGKKSPFADKEQSKIGIKQLVTPTTSAFL